MQANPAKDLNAVAKFPSNCPKLCWKAIHFVKGTAICGKKIWLTFLTSIPERHPVIGAIRIVLDPIFILKSTDWTAGVKYLLPVFALALLIG